MLVHWVLVLNIAFGSGSSSVTIDKFNSEVNCETGGMNAKKKMEAQFKYKNLLVTYTCVKTDELW